MEGKKIICLDSCFIIDFLKGDQGAKRAYDKHKDKKFYTAEICVYEVCCGLFYAKGKPEGNKRLFDQFMDFISTIELIPMTNLFAMESAKIFAELKCKGKMIDDADCLVAGMTLSSGCSKIITRNKKHFSNIKGLDVIGY